MQIYSFNTRNDLSNLKDVCTTFLVSIFCTFLFFLLLSESFSKYSLHYNCMLTIFTYVCAFLQTNERAYLKVTSTSPAGVLWRSMCSDYLIIHQPPLDIYLYFDPPKFWRWCQIQLSAAERQRQGGEDEIISELSPYFLTACWF